MKKLMMMLFVAVLTAFGAFAADRQAVSAAVPNFAAPTAAATVLPLQGMAKMPVASLLFSPVSAKMVRTATSSPKGSFAHGPGLPPDGVCDPCASCGFWEGVMCYAGYTGGCYQSCPSNTGQ